MTDEQVQVFVEEFLKTLEPIGAANAAEVSPRKLYSVFGDERVKEKIRCAADYGAFFLRVVADESASLKDRMHAAEVLAKLGSADGEVKIEVEYV